MNPNSTFRRAIEARVWSLPFAKARAACCLTLAVWGFSGAAVFGAGSTGEPSAEPLGLDEAMLRALKLHYAVRTGELNVQSAAAQVEVEKGAFDPSLLLSHESYRSMPLGGENATVMGEGELQKLTLEGSLSSGTRYGMSLSHRDDEVAGNVAEWSAELRQSLLKNRGVAVNRAPIRIASRRHEVSKEAFRLEVTDTLVEVQLAYMELQLADESLRVAEESLALSAQLLEENRKRASVGSIAASDLLQAEAEVAAREDQVYQSVLRQAQARRRLKQLVSDEALSMLGWKWELQPLPEVRQRTVDVEQDYRIALAERPDYRQAVLRLDIAGIEKMRQENQSLPSLDLYARMSLQGLGDGFEDSVEALSDADKPGYAVGVEWSRPLLNRAAKYRSVVAGHEQRRQRWGLRQLEQAILFDLEASAVELEQNWRRLESAKRGRVLAEASLQAEQKRYQNGASSTFVIIRLQTDLANARIRELLAMTDYRKTLVLYDRQMGVVLDLHQVQL
jgi:outer membrane protein TolC